MGNLARMIENQLDSLEKIFPSLSEFSKFIVIHAVKGFGIVNKAEVDFFFLEFSCFFDDPRDVGN